MLSTLNSLRIAFRAFVVFCAFSSFFIAAPSPAGAQAQLKNNLCAGTELSVAGGSCATATAGGGCVDTTGAAAAAGRCNSAGELNTLISNIINVLSIIVGIVAVIMIILGGFKYITSGGDSGNISSAKTTIIYAIVGLVIVALAQVIVRFVLSKATA